MYCINVITHKQTLISVAIHKKAELNEIELLYWQLEKYFELLFRLKWIYVVLYRINAHVLFHGITQDVI